MSVASFPGPGRLGSAAPSLSPAGVTTVPSASWWLAPTPSPTPALGRTSTWRCSTTVSPTVSYLVPRGHVGYPLNQTVPGGDPWTTTTTHVYTHVGLGPPLLPLLPNPHSGGEGPVTRPSPLPSLGHRHLPPTQPHCHLVLGLRPLLLSSQLPLGALPLHFPLERQGDPYGPRHTLPHPQTCQIRCVEEGPGVSSADLTSFACSLSADCCKAILVPPPRTPAPREALER